MRMDLSAPRLLPFDPADRPGVAKGTVSTKLSPLDLSGVIHRAAKRQDTLPAVGAPVMDLPGTKPVANPNANDPAVQAARVEQHARQLVSQTFFGTMLKQMRDSPFKSELFEGGRGGQAFSGLFDQKLVDQMSRGAGNKLVNAVVRKFEGKKAYGAQRADNLTQERSGTRQDLGANSAMTIDPPAAAPTGGASVPTAAERDATNPYRNIKIHVAPAFRT